MAVPELTSEQRKAALEKAMETRSARAELNRRLKAGEISVTAYMSDPVGKRTKVYKMLTCIPGVGPAKAREFMDEYHISETRRVQGLGSNQYTAITEAFGRTR